MCMELSAKNKHNKYILPLTNHENSGTRFCLSLSQFSYLQSDNKNSIHILGML